MPKTRIEIRCENPKRSFNLNPSDNFVWDGGDSLLLRKPREDSFYHFRGVKLSSINRRYGCVNTCNNTQICLSAFYFYNFKEYLPCEILVTIYPDKD